MALVTHKLLVDKCQFCGLTLCYHCPECGNHVFDEHKDGCSLDPTKVQEALDRQRESEIQWVLTGEGPKP
jgi:hypothetical protein